MTTTPQLKILLVDDDEALLETVSDMLSMLDGLQVETARSGLEALRLLDRFKPELALVDIRMPGMDGWELVQVMRQRKEKPKIIMLTGSYAEEDIRAAFERGVDGYLLKPVRVNLLHSLVNNVINDVPLENQFPAEGWGHG